MIKLIEVPTGGFHIDTAGINGIPLIWPISGAQSRGPYMTSRVPTFRPGNLIFRFPTDQHSPPHGRSSRGSRSSSSLQSITSSLSFPSTSSMLVHCRSKKHAHSKDVSSTYYSLGRPLSRDVLCFIFDMSQQPRPLG